MWGGNHVAFIEVVRKACLFQQRLLKGSLRSKISFVVVAKNLSSWCHRVRQPFPLPHSPQDVRFGLCLVIDSAGETFGKEFHVSISVCGSSLWFGGGVPGERIPGRRCDEHLSMCLRGDGM